MYISGVAVSLFILKHFSYGKDVILFRCEQGARISDARQLFSHEVPLVVFLGYDMGGEGLVGL